MYLIVLPLLVIALAAGCKSMECGPGTSESNGSCVPASLAVTAAKCGPFTMLQGDTCVPMFPPTTCDPDSTQPDTDQATGVTTCIGTGGGGCAARLPCPTPTVDGVETVCGQIYDFETNQPFANPGAMGVRCSPGATTGPCALGIHAFDAVAFAGSMGASPPLATGDVYLDDCGRYQVPNIAVGSLMAPFVALGFDDFDLTTKKGPLGLTNTVGLVAPAVSKGAVKDFDAFVVPKATSDKWAGMPPFDATHGVFAAVYRAHSTGPDLASGVAFARLTGGATTSVFYLGGTTRGAVDTSAASTGATGTALVGISGTVAATDQYSGTGGLPVECKWDNHGAAAIGFAVFIQIFRPTSATNATCTL
jgi:hypothetical protein